MMSQPQGAMARYILQQMDLPVWQLRKPNLFGQTAATVTLPDHVELLLVSEIRPQGELFALVVKILSTMALTPEQVAWIPAEMLPQIHQHQLTWCWCAHASPPTLPAALAGIKSLQSCPLDALAQNEQAKRQLWQQIKQQR